MSDLKVNIKDKGIGRELLETGVHEPKSTNYLKSILKDNWVVLEVGANIGYYARIEANKCKKVVCFEPDPTNFKYLKQNMKGFKNVKLHLKALSDERGTSRFYLSEMNNRHTLIPNENDFIEVETKTVDDLYKRFDFVRMDVEGAESKVLDGMEKTFKYAPPKSLFIEFHPIELGEQGLSVKALLTGLKNRGYIVKKAFFENSFQTIRMVSISTVWSNFWKSHDKAGFVKNVLFHGRKEFEYDDLKGLLGCPVLDIRASEVFLELKE